MSYGNSKFARRHLAPVLIAFLAAITFAFGSVTAAHANELPSPMDDVGIQPRMMYESVVDTHWQYRCPNGVSGHNIGMYNISYRNLAFPHTYSVSRIREINRSYPALCSCGRGTAIQYKYEYTIS